MMHDQRNIKSVGCPPDSACNSCPVCKSRCNWGTAVFRHKPYRKNY